MRALHLFSISLSLCVYFWLRDLSVRLCVFMCVYVCEDYTASGPDLVHMLLGNPPPPSLPPPVTITSSRLCVLQCTNLTGRSQKLDDLSKTH